MNDQKKTPCQTVKVEGIAGEGESRWIRSGTSAEQVGPAIWKDLLLLLRGGKRGRGRFPDPVV
jgi:hypothetical protein